MGFGFDANIILSGPRLAQESANASNTLAERDLNQAKLSDLLYQQQRQRSLVDLASQNPTNYADPTAQAMARAGYVDEAAQQQSRQDQFDALHTSILRSRFAAAKTPEQYGKLFSGISPEGQDKLKGFGLTAEYDPEAVQSFVASGMAPEKQADYQTSQAQRAAGADANSPFSLARVSLANKYGGNLQAGTPGNAISDKMLDDLEKGYAADLRAKAMGLGSGSGTGTLPEIEQGALDIQVENAVRRGEAPKFGSGPLGYKQRVAFWNRVNALYPGADLATAHANYQAQMHNLSEATSQAGAQDVKEGKALGDIKILQGTMGKIWGSNIPALNAIGRTVQSAMGDPNYRAYTTALEATLPTINSVLNSGQMSVGAREEVKGLLREKDSPAAMSAALNILIQDMQRSTEATHKRITNARGAISAKPGAAQEEAPAGSSGPGLDHSAAAEWLRNPTNRTDSNYGRALQAYKKANGGAEP